MQDITNTTPLLVVEPSLSSIQPIQVTQTTQPEVRIKKGINFKLIGFITIGLLLITCVISIVIAIPYLRNNFIPGVSPITEGLTSSPSEQVGARVSPYITMANTATDLYSKDSNNILDKLNFKDIPISSNTFGFDYEYIYNKTDLGTTDNISDEQFDSSFLGSFVNGKDVSLILKGEGKSNYNSSTNMQSDQSITISTTNDGITAESAFYLKTNNNDVYFNIDTIPDIGIENIETIVGKWYSTSQRDLVDSVSAFDPNESITNVGFLNKVKNALLTSKELYYKPTLEKNIKIAGEESFHGITVKCYSLTLGKSGIVSLTAEINTLIKDPANQITLTESDMDGFEELNINLCFDKNSVLIHKFDVSLKTSNTTSNLIYDLTFGIYDLGKKEEILMPTEFAPINDVLNDLFVNSIEEVTEPEQPEIPELDYNPDMGY
jgi:hypothetical protein